MRTLVVAPSPWHVAEYECAGSHVVGGPRAMSVVGAAGAGALKRYSTRTLSSTRRLPLLSLAHPPRTPSLPHLLPSWAQVLPRMRGPARKIAGPRAGSHVRDARVRVARVFHHRLLLHHLRHKPRFALVACASSARLRPYSCSESRRPPLLAPLRRQLLRQRAILPT